MADAIVTTSLALVLAAALLGMVARLVVPLVRGEWVAQTEQVAARVVLLASLPLATTRRRRHAKRRFGRAA